METSISTSTDAAGRADGARPEAPGALPNVVVIGSQKCGTSTLHYYLRFHPDVSASVPKELDFFISERNWPLGVDWYRTHFDPEAKARVESSPNYTTYPHFQGVPERMHELVPEARLIYLVRDPIARIEAHWVHNYAKRRERGTPLETILHPSTTYIERSRYAMQLEQFLRFYDRSRILVLEQDDLRRRRRDTLSEVFEFIGIESTFDHRSFRAVRHRTEKKRRASRAGLRVKEMSKTSWGRRVPKALWNYTEAGLRLSRPIERPNLHDQLPAEVLRTLREDAERLRELTGREFASWSIWDLPA
jgi:Sulfotransferase domain